MCEKAGKQVRFRLAEALKFYQVILFYFPTPRIIPENHDDFIYFLTFSGGVGTYYFI